MALRMAVQSFCEWERSKPAKSSVARPDGIAVIPAALLGP